MHRKYRNLVCTSCTSLLLTELYSASHVGISLGNTAEKPVMIVNFHIGSDWSLLIIIDHVGRDWRLVVHFKKWEQLIKWVNINIFEQISRYWDSIVMITIGDLQNIEPMTFIDSNHQ